MCVGIATHGEAKVFFTQKEALAVAFPEADRVEQETYVLTEAQLQKIQKRARSRLDSRLIAIYTGYRNGVVLGHAHIDTHIVRTKSEGFMVVLDPSGQVESVRVLAFFEPLDFLPSQGWYDLFVGKGEGDSLRLGRDVDGISGATLSARAATEGVRRMLAYYEILVGG